MSTYEMYDRLIIKIDKFEVVANTPVNRLLIVGIEVFGGYEEVKYSTHI